MAWASSCLGREDGTPGGIKIRPVPGSGGVGGGSGPARGGSLIPLTLYSASKRVGVGG